MTNLEQAARQALSALEAEHGLYVPHEDNVPDATLDAIVTLREVLLTDIPALNKLLNELDKKAGSGFIPWEIEDAFAEYVGIKERTK